MEGILGVPVDPGTGQRTNSEILHTAVLCGIHKEVVPSAWQSPQTDESVGGTHPVCGELALRSSGSPRCGYEGSTWRGGTAQLWRWVRTVTQSGQHNLIVHGHDTIFKAHHVQIQQNALWIFDCRSGGSDGPRKIWAMTDYTHIVSQGQCMDGGNAAMEHAALTAASKHRVQRYRA